MNEAFRAASSVPVHQLDHFIVFANRDAFALPAIGTYLQVGVLWKVTQIEGHLHESCCLIVVATSSIGHRSSNARL